MNFLRLLGDPSWLRNLKGVVLVLGFGSVEMNPRRKGVDLGIFMGLFEMGTPSSRPSMSSQALITSGSSRIRGGDVLDSSTGS